MTRMSIDYTYYSVPFVINNTRVRIINNFNKQVFTVIIINFYVSSYTWLYFKVLYIYILTPAFDMELT